MPFDPFVHVIRFVEAVWITGQRTSFGRDFCVVFFGSALSESALGETKAFLFFFLILPRRFGAYAKAQRLSWDQVFCSYLVFFGELFGAVLLVVSGTDFYARPLPISSLNDRGRGDSIISVTNIACL